jgi:hydrogenase expression/formation protein HypC
MCLAVTGKVLEREGLSGTVELNGVRIHAGFHLVPEVEVGDYVLLHAGFAIQVIDEGEALETRAMVEELIMPPGTDDGGRGGEG